MNTAEKESIIEQVSDHVFALLRDSLPQQLVYHNFLHTMEVVEAVEEIGIGSGLDDDDLEILAIAAWFHDAGYTEIYKGHEERGAEMAEKFLRERGYPEENIPLIIGCILATRVPQRPRNILEEVICDADLGHLGRKTFNERNELLRLEWELALGKQFTDLEWSNLTIDFLGGNPYHTRFAQVELSPQRAENLVMVQNYRRRLKARGEARQRREPPAQPAPVVVPEEGTMLGIISRSHLDLVSTADTNANIMIAVNALIVVVAILLTIAGGSGARVHLALPTSLLVMVCVATMIGAALVVRPGGGMRRMLRGHIDRVEELAGGAGGGLRPGMIADLGTLGGMVEAKYRSLRIVYGIFAYGLLLSAIAYLLALLPFSRIFRIF